MAPWTAGMSSTLETDTDLEARRPTSESTPGPVAIVMLVYNEAEVIEHVVRGFHTQIVRRLPGSEFIVAED